MSDLPIISASAVSKRFSRKHGWAARIGLRAFASELFYRQRPSPEIIRPREFFALRKVSFSVKPGESIAIVGRNGSGKTTLARVLSGIYKPDGGKVISRGRVVALFARGAGFAPSLTGSENISINLALLGVKPREVRAKRDAIVSFADLPPGSLEAPVKTYSSGMRARLAFACAVHTEPELMIVDEALAVGDLQFRSKCYNRLAELNRKGISFIIVSHNLKGLLQVCERALYLEAGRLVADGPATQVINEYRRDLNLKGENGESLPISSTGAVEKARIRAFYLLNSKGERTRSLETGLPASLVVECEADESVEKLTAIALFKDASGELGTLFTLDSAQSGVFSNVSLGGTCLLRAEIPSLRLGPGDYFIKLWIAGGSRHNVLDGIEAYPFEVRANLATALFDNEVSLVTFGSP